MMTKVLRVLIINTDYPDFVQWLYNHIPGLENRSFNEQMRARIRSLFGFADFYSSNLKRLGHEAWNIYANNSYMQSAWEREHLSGSSNVLSSRYLLPFAGLRSFSHIERRTTFRPVRRCLRLLRLGLEKREHKWLFRVLAGQVSYYQPDVILNQAMVWVKSEYLRESMPKGSILVGQHAASPLPENSDWKHYNLILSSFPPTVEWFRSRGISTELHLLGFEPAILNQLRATQSKNIPISFIGSFFKIHSSRTELIERLRNQFDVRIWGSHFETIDDQSPVFAGYMGQAWGTEMYQILRDSKIVFNHHGNVAPFANNLRLYEATGVGTLLLTDWKENLPSLFEPGKEVVAYRSFEECVDLLRFYLNNENARDSIAHAGQLRTLHSHTYFQRMQELEAIFNRYL